VVRGSGAAVPRALVSARAGLRGLGGLWCPPWAPRGGACLARPSAPSCPA